MEDDDDIEWSENPFDRPHRAKPESPDAFLAMIQFESTTALQQALRTLCREFIDIFSTVVRPLPAKVMSMVIDIDRSKWELPSNRLTASRHFTAFMTMGGLYQWNRVAMGLKGAGPYFQRSMSNTVLAGLVSQICELYIDDVLIHGRDIETFLANVRKVFERLREFNVAVNPAKTKLGLAEVEYEGRVISATGISFTEEKRLKVLQFPLPETQTNLLQTISGIMSPT
jgi:hypothetical protein